MEWVELIEYNDAALLFRMQGEEGFEYFLMRPNVDEKPMNMGGLKFLNFNKGIGKHLGGCASVAAKAETKTYERTESSLRMLVRDLGACEG